MKKTLTLIIILLALSLAACGKSSPSARVNITITDFSFSPNEFTIPAGTDITVNATHNGTVVHNFIIMKAGTDAGDMFDQEDEANVYWSIEIQPGTSQTAVFTAPDQPGVYQILCGMPGHMQSGMVGILTVVK